MLSDKFKDDIQHNKLATHRNKISLLFLGIVLITQQILAAPYSGNQLPASGYYQGSTTSIHGIQLDVDVNTLPNNEILTGTSSEGYSLSSGLAGNGLQVNGNDLILQSLTNNGNITGGTSSGTGGRGVNLENISIEQFTNNASITGGAGNIGGDALYLDDTDIGELVNNGIIKGGGRNSSGGSGIAIDNGSSATIYNSKQGQIAGGDGTGNGGNGIYLSGNGTNEATIHNQGLITAGNEGAAAIYVSGGATATVVNSGTISKGVNSANAIQLMSSGNTIELQTGGVFGGDLYAGATNQTFIFNANKASGVNTFDLSTLKGWGWTNDNASNTSVFKKEGQYTWILTGEADTGTGSWIDSTKWEVNAGNLVAGAQISDNTVIRGTIDVNNGANLSGFGTVTGAVNVNAGGTITAGYNSVGTMQVGELNFDANATYWVNADSTGTDLISVDGSLGGANLGAGNGQAYLNGANVYVEAGQGWQVGDYKILETANAGDVIGQFGNVNTNLIFLNASVQNTANNKEVWLSLVRNSMGFADVAISRNQTQTASGLESLASNNPLKNTIVGLSLLDARSAYDNLSGEIHSSVQASLLNDRYIRDAINTHLIDRFETQGTGLWMSTWGATENLGSDNNAAKISNNVFGFMVGADNNLNETTKAGIAFGYQHNNINLNKGRHSDAEIDSYHLAGYIGKQFAHDINLRAGVDYAYLNVRTDRKVQVGSIRESNKDSYHGNLIQGFVEISKGIAISDKFKVEPYLNVAHVYMDTKFNEGNKLTALKGSGENQATFSTTGVRGKLQVTNKAKLVIGAGWQHAYGNRKADTDVRFNGSSYFNVTGVPITKDATIADIGLEIGLTPNTSISANYQGQFGSKVENNALKLGLNYKF